MSINWNAVSNQPQSDCSIQCYTAIILAKDGPYNNHSTSVFKQFLINDECCILLLPWAQCSLIVIFAQLIGLYFMLYHMPTWHTRDTLLLLSSSSNFLQSSPPLSDLIDMLACQKFNRPYYTSPPNLRPRCYLNCSFCIFMTYHLSCFCHILKPSSFVHVLMMSSPIIWLLYSSNRSSNLLVAKKCKVQDNILHKHWWNFSIHDT